MAPRRLPNSQNLPAPSPNESAQAPRARSTRSSSSSLNTNQPQRAPPETLQPTTAQSRSGSNQQLGFGPLSGMNFVFPSQKLTHPLFQAHSHDKAELQVRFHSFVSDPAQPVMLLSEGQPPVRTGAAHLPAITETVNDFLLLALS